jgi:hypothetical protein
MRRSHVTARAGILRDADAVFVEAANTTSRNIKTSIATVPAIASAALEKKVLPRAKAAITPAMPRAYLTCGTAFIAAPSSLLEPDGLKSI